MTQVNFTILYLKMSTTSMERPRSSSALKKWARDRGEDEVGREGTYLKVMGKRPVLVRNNRKPKSTIFHALGCDLPETSINKVQAGLTKFYSMFAEFVKELYRVHTCPAVAIPQKREEWTHQPCGAMVTDMKDRNSDK